jgi:hypothetical protein
MPNRRRIVDAVNKLSMTDETAILGLLRRGWSDRRISREAGYHRATIRRIRHEAEFLASKCTTPAEVSTDPKPATAPKVATELRRLPKRLVHLYIRKRRRNTASLSVAVRSPKSNGAEYGVTGNERLIRDVFREHRFADSVGTDKDHVRRLRNEVERQDCFDGTTIASRRPVPIELVDRLESPESCAFEPPFETSANVFLFFPLHERGKPRRLGDFRPMPEQAVQAERLCTLA